MNTLFIDWEEPMTNTKAQEEKIPGEKMANWKHRMEMKLLGYTFYSDILNNGISANSFSLIIGEKWIRKFQAKRVSKFSTWLYTKLFSLALRKQEKIHVVWSRYFDQPQNERDIQNVVSLLQGIPELKVKVMKQDNTMEVNDIHYMEEYIKAEKLNLNKLKILVVINDINDYKEEKLKEYIAKYKFVDILRMGGITKMQYQKIVDSVNRINEEYGSTIEITQKRNVQEYAIYVMYSKVTKEEFISHYIIRKKAKYLEMKDADQDVHHENMKEYNKKKYDIETLLKRIKLDINRFSQNKLGALLLEDTKKLDK